MAEKKNKTIGILCGKERVFPDHFIRSVNEKYEKEGVQASYVTVSPPALGDAVEYDVIIDRISHEVPYYRTWLKYATLGNTYVINNPHSWHTQDDKFYAYQLATQAGIAVPRTVMLPQKQYMEGIEPMSLHNMTHPVEWQKLLDYIGTPAIMKPNHGGGWKHVYRIDSVQQMLDIYNRTGELTMILQQFIDFDAFVRCICIGREFILPIRYDPKHPDFFQRYIVDPNYLPKDLHARVVGDAMKLNKLLGYDMNSVEFAIKDGVPYAIDFTNPAPDMDRASIKPEHFDVVLEKMVSHAVKCAKEGRRTADDMPYDARVKALKK